MSEVEEMSMSSAIIEMICYPQNCHAEVLISSFLETTTELILNLKKLMIISSSNSWSIWVLASAKDSDFFTSTNAVTPHAHVIINLDTSSMNAEIVDSFETTSSSLTCMITGINHNDTPVKIDRYLLCKWNQSPEAKWLLQTTM